MKLATKLTLVVVSAMALVVGASSTVSIVEQRGQLLDDAEADNAVMARTLADGVASAYRHGGEEAARDLVDIVDRNNPEVSFAWFTPAGGVAGRVVPGPDWPRDVDSVASDAAVMDGSRALGMVSVVDSLEGDEAILRGRVERLLLTTLIMAVVGASVAVALGRRYISGPVAALQARAARIGHGDFSGPLRISGGDELAELAASMNAMADDLTRALADLEHASGARIAALEQLRHAERLATVGKLAAGIAHEMGTPLNVVDARAAMIESDETTPPESRRFATLIREQTARMAMVIRQLLGFARQQPGVHDRVDLAALVDRVSDFVRPLARRRDVLVRVVRPGPAHAHGDRAQLEQVLTNVCVNAIQACAKGGSVVVRVHPRSRIAAPPDVAQPAGGFSCVEVEDDGCGIAPEDLPRVFEPFFTTKDVGQGTGLGLSVAYGIVRDHGGWLTADNLDDGGCSFCVFLPRAEAA
jgi:signal transduction histidine kinase